MLHFNNNHPIRLAVSCRLAFFHRLYSHFKTGTKRWHSFTAQTQYLTPPLLPRNVAQIATGGQAAATNQQNKQPEQTGESHNGEPMFQGAISRSKALIIPARTPRAQGEGKHSSLTTCFIRTMSTHIPNL